MKHLLSQTSPVDIRFMPELTSRPLDLLTVWNTWKRNCTNKPQSANELLFSKSCNIKDVFEPNKCRPTTCGLYNISKNAFHFLFLLQYVIVVDRFELYSTIGFPLEHFVSSSKSWWKLLTRFVFIFLNIQVQGWPFQKADWLDETGQQTGQWLKCVASPYLLFHKGFGGIKGVVEKHVACGPFDRIPSHIHGGGALFVDVHVLHSTERHYKGEHDFSLFLFCNLIPDYPSKRTEARMGTWKHSGWNDGCVTRWNGTPWEAMVGWEWSWDTHVMEMTDRWTDKQICKCQHTDNKWNNTMTLCYAKQHHAVCNSYFQSAVKEMMMLGLSHNGN